jgi:porin
VPGDDNRGIGTFARASCSPPDRNLIDYYADAGLEFIGLNDPRPKTSLALPPPMRMFFAVGARA